MNNIFFEEHNPEVIKEKLQLELREYNRLFLGKYERQNFAAYILGESGNIIAGVYGFTIMPYHTMRLELVWVHEEYRGQGLGYKILKYAEQYAHSKKCKIIQVSTGKWQGEGFYRKMGYTVIGVIPLWFCDQDEIFFIKKLEHCRSQDLI